MFIKKISRFIIIFFISIFYSTQIAVSNNLYNDLYTLNLYNQSYCHGSGGSWGGLTCDRGRINSSGEGSVIGAIIGAAVLAAIFGQNSGQQNSNKNSISYDEIRLTELQTNRKFDSIKNDTQFQNLEDLIINLLENKIIKIGREDAVVRYYSILKGGYASLLREFGPLNKNDFNIKKELEYTQHNIQKGRIHFWSIKFIGNIPNLCISRRRDGIINCYALEFIQGKDLPISNFIGQSKFFTRKDAEELTRWDYSFSSNNIILGSSKINVQKFKEYATEVYKRSKIIDTSLIADSKLKECIQLHSNNSNATECKNIKSEANQKYSSLRVALDNYQNFVKQNNTTKKSNCNKYERYLRATEGVAPTSYKKYKDLFDKCRASVSPQN